MSPPYPRVPLIEFLVFRLAFYRRISVINTSDITNVVVNSLNYDVFGRFDISLFQVLSCTSESFFPKYVFCYEKGIQKFWMNFPNVAVTNDQDIWVSKV